MFVAPRFSFEWGNEIKSFLSHDKACVCSTTRDAVHAMHGTCSVGIAARTQRRRLTINGTDMDSADAEGGEVAPQADTRKRTRACFLTRLLNYHNVRERAHAKRKGLQTFELFIKSKVQKFVCAHLPRAACNSFTIIKIAYLIEDVE